MGSHPMFDEVVISLKWMNKIRGFDESYGILSLEAGVILQTANEYANMKGYMMPVDLGARGSC